MFTINSDYTKFILSNAQQQTLPAAWPTGLALRLRGQPSANAAAYLDALWEKIQYSHQLKTRSDYPAEELHYEYAARLRPYQRVDAAWLAYARRGLLWEDPGLGKTASTLAGLAHAGVADNIIVICPASIIAVWQQEIATWSPQTSVCSHIGISEREAGTHVTLVSYSIAKARPGLLKHPWKAIIVDECHAIANRRSQQSTFIRQLCKRNAEAYLFMLSGTPIPNTVDQLWPTLYCLDPQGFSSYHRFVHWYCALTPGPYADIVTGIEPERSKEYEQATKPYIRRVAKVDVAIDLPPKRYQTIKVELSCLQRKAYNETSRELETLALSGEKITAATALTKLIRLLQYCAATPNGMDSEAKLHLGLPSSKLDLLLELVKQRKNEPLVIFMVNVDLANMVYESLQNLGRKVGLLSGKTPAEVRGVIVKEFQRGSIDTVVATLATAGQGITLTRARTAIFLQRSWSYVESRQAEDRIHRLGSQHHESIEIIDIVAAGTVEETHLQPVTQGKIDLVQDVLKHYTS